VRTLVDGGGGGSGGGTQHSQPHVIPLAGSYSSSQIVQFLYTLPQRSTTCWYKSMTSMLRAAMMGSAAALSCSTIVSPAAR